MPGKIFINYRRGDDAGFTQALYQRLEREFASGDLFMDVEGHIKPGDDFVEVLNAQVAASDVILAVIGQRWAELLAARQGDPEDFLAIEIKAALDLRKRVIPVLVGGASMPRADSLPEAIRPLAHRNAVGLRPERFGADCQGLIAALKEALATAEQERAARTEAERKAAEAARLEAEAQAAARAKAAEERGREQAVAGLSADEIRKAEELASWDFVKDSNQIQDLRDHLARFPGGMTGRYALDRLDALVWAGLGATPKIEHLSAYLNEFPEGANAGAAQARIATMEREEDAVPRGPPPSPLPPISISTEPSSEKPPSKSVSTPAEPSELVSHHGERERHLLWIVPILMISASVLSLIYFFSQLKHDRLTAPTSTKSESTPAPAVNDRGGNVSPPLTQSFENRQVQGSAPTSAPAATKSADSTHAPATVSGQTGDGRENVMPMSSVPETGSYSGAFEGGSLALYFSEVGFKGERSFNGTLYCNNGMPDPTPLHGSITSDGRFSVGGGGIILKGKFPNIEVDPPCGLSAQDRPIDVVTIVLQRDSR
jgi:hypothetical protein